MIQQEIDSMTIIGEMMELWDIRITNMTQPET